MSPSCPLSGVARCDDLIVVTTAADAAADISELARDITCADEGHNNV
jgi:hypothetical protein